MSQIYLITSDQQHGSSLELKRNAAADMAPRLSSGEGAPPERSARLLS